MSEPLQVSPDEIRRCMDEESLREWIAAQRWYASKSRSVSGIEVVEGIPVGEDPLLYLASAGTRADRRAQRPAASDRPQRRMDSLRRAGGSGPARTARSADG